MNLAELESRITQHILNMTPDVLQSVVEHAVSRFELAADNGGKSDNKDCRFSIRKTADQVKISTSSSQANLCDDVHSDCEICSQASISRREKLLIAVTQNSLDTINAELGFLRLLTVPENENAFERTSFSEKR
ncbi:hypothetical protein TNCV_4485841 [Trichonephila clavipes]|nr:hypothetical protein TNCV_4485841 [Trichonephila clavipes]